jgi:hypothetical protein
VHFANGTPVRAAARTNGLSEYCESPGSPQSRPSTPGADDHGGAALSWNGQQQMNRARSSHPGDGEGDNRTVGAAAGGAEAAEVTEAAEAESVVEAAVTQSPYHRGNHHQFPATRRLHHLQSLRERKTARWTH